MPDGHDRLSRLRWSRLGISIEGADPAEFVRANAEEYRRVARIVDCSVRYPRDNRCRRCARRSQSPLVPDRHGWLCNVCAYPAEDEMGTP